MPKSGVRAFKWTQLCRAPPHAIAPSQPSMLQLIDLHKSDDCRRVVRTSAAETAAELASKTFPPSSMRRPAGKPARTRAPVRKTTASPGRPQNRWAGFGIPRQPTPSSVRHGCRGVQRGGGTPSSWQSAPVHRVQNRSRRAQHTPRLPGRRRSLATSICTWWSSPWATPRGRGPCARRGTRSL